MERDFMGLNAKDSVVVVKEEAVEGCKEQVYSKSSALHWPSSNGFDSFNNRQGGESQKSINLTRQGGTHFSMTAYPMQQSVHSVQLPHDTKQAVPVTVSSPFFRAQFAGAPIKQQLLGGVPVSAPHSVLPSAGTFVAGTTEPWFSSKASSAPAQLTIFYGGMVNVYDDISPEKAQAIMLLAGNGAAVAANTTQPRAQPHVPTPRTPAGDAVYASQPINTPACSPLSSPMSVSSPLTGGPSHKDEGSKTMGGSATPGSKVDTPRVMSPLGPVLQSAVPQARKASLARFLEKRKERVMASSPYSQSKSSSETNPASSAILAAGEGGGR